MFLALSYTADAVAYIEDLSLKKLCQRRNFEAFSTINIAHALNYQESYLEII